jgi:hypothetical protein
VNIEAGRLQHLNITWHGRPVHGDPMFLLHDVPDLIGRQLMLSVGMYIPLNQPTCHG